MICTPSVSSSGLNFIHDEGTCSFLGAIGGCRGSSLLFHYVNYTVKCLCTPSCGSHSFSLTGKPEKSLLTAVQ